jgi:hypothetical protein
MGGIPQQITLFGATLEFLHQHASEVLQNWAVSHGFILFLRQISWVGCRHISHMVDMDALVLQLTGQPYVFVFTLCSAGQVPKPMEWKTMQSLPEIKELPWIFQDEGRRK